VLAWLLLGIGNLIGAWWAYVELGWGGYWAWDPVENAGLMPWLVATAFLHSSIMQRRRGTFRVWTLALIIMTFCLVIFGTFISRSGILSSVHTFNDSGMTPFFMGFLSLALLGSLGLLYYRYGRLKAGGAEALVSRDSTFLLNNILLTGTSLVILVGTIFPSISRAVSGLNIDLNASFFNQVNGPLFLAIILLTGICAVVGWKQASIRNVLRRLLVPLVGAIVITIILFITAVREAVPLIAFMICAFVLFSVLNELIRGARVRHISGGDSYFTAWWKMLRAGPQRYGGYIVHAGIALIAVGVIGSSFYNVQTEATLKVGSSLQIKQYSITFNGLEHTSSADKDSYAAQLSVFNSGHLVADMVPLKYFQIPAGGQADQAQSVTEVAIRSTPLEDLYIILEGWSNNGTTADFKVLVNPLVIWIWIGGGVFLVGGLVAFWPGRRGRELTKADRRESSGEN
jgi:cytochrome c-type biogenesis protein CcmF